MRDVLRSPEILAQAVREVRTERPGTEEAQAIEALQSIEQVWDQLFSAEQSQIARTLIERITVAPNGISIKWRGEGLNKLLRDTLESNALREAA